MRELRKKILEMWHAFDKIDIPSSFSIIVISVMGVLLSFWLLPRERAMIYAIAFAAVLITTLIYYSVRFLYGRSKVHSSVERHYSNRDVRQQVKDELEKNTDWKMVEEKIKEKIDLITSEELLNQVKEKYENRLIEDIRTKVLERDLTAIKIRVGQEIDRTNRNGIVNLMIGIIMTIGAVFFLITSVYTLNVTEPERSDFLVFIIPRISIVLLVELFSFFFLRLYRRNLEDMKYLNNELTNIDLKLIALRASIVYDDPESRKLVIQELAKTERNFILKKGESTVGIKLEEQNSKDMENMMKLAKMMRGE